MRLQFSLYVVLVFWMSGHSTLAADFQPVSAADLVAVRDIGGRTYGGAINLSPDRRWVAFQLQTPNVIEGTFDLDWHVMERSYPYGKRRIADGGDLILNPSLAHKVNGTKPRVRAYWSPDSNRFAYLLRKDGETQVWMSRPDRPGQRQLTDNAADVIDFRWAPDGSKIYFATGLDRQETSSALQQEGARGFLYDGRFELYVSREPFQRECGIGLPFDMFTVSLARACEPTHWVYVLDSQTERLATPDEADAYQELRNRSASLSQKVQDGPRVVNDVRQWSDAEQYAWLENEDPQTYQNLYAPLTVHAAIDDKKYRCKEEACRGHQFRGHQDLWWRQDGQEVVFLRRDGPSHSKTGLYAWTPSSGRLRTILQTEDWLFDCAPADNELICVHEAWTRPPSIVAVSLDDGVVTTLYDPNPVFAKRQFSKIEKLEWEDAFGNATHGHLVYPKDYEAGRQYPLVIVTYQSRGFLRGGVGDEYPIHPLAAEGFFVLSHEMPLDLEGIAMSSDPNKFLFTNLYWRNATLSAQEGVVEMLVSRGLVDASRVAITGLSEGAAQTTYALIHSDAFAAAIVSSVAFGPATHGLSSSHRKAYWRHLLDGEPHDEDSGWAQISIGLNANRVNTPLLINVSDEELLMAVENFSLLQEAGKPVEMYVFPDEHHIKWQPDHRLAIYRRNIQWLKFWLLDVEDSNPLDPKQYERWRSLREQQIHNLEAQGRDDTPPVPSQ